MIIFIYLAQAQIDLCVDFKTVAHLAIFIWNTSR